LSEEVTHLGQGVAMARGARSGRFPALRVVLVRFAITDAVEIIPQALLGRRPFVAARPPVPARRLPDPVVSHEKLVLDALRAGDRRASPPSASRDRPA
jgi:hypothetical protein